MSWMGGSGSFESRAKRAFGSQQKEKLAGADLLATEADARAALSAPLHGFSSRASALFDKLDRTGCNGAAPKEAEKRGDI